MRNDVLVVEISGKRPGGSDKRPTEKFTIQHDHLIISNNADGYITNWPIVMVPDDFKEDYISRYKTSENAWYAPMNRSYAIKYAREKGYKYLVQLDDNIYRLEIAYLLKGRIAKRYRATSSTDMMDDFIEMLVCVLENTDASMAGCGLSGVAIPDKTFMSERYVYSLFALDLSVCPDCFQGDFEDDIEYRLKLGQMGVPAVQVAPLRYTKTSQFSGKKDESGNRAAYTKAGTARGEHMLVLYGDKYSCGLRSKTAGIRCEKKAGTSYFQHRLIPWKVGVKVRDRGAIEEKFTWLLAKYAKKTPDKYVIKEKKVKKDAHGQTT